MGRLDVRRAITTAITAANLPYVGTVYPARPVILDEQDYAQTLSGEAIATTAGGSSAVLVVNMPDDARTRYADVGRGAVADFDIHVIGLEIFFASNPASATTQVPAGIQAQYDYDTIVDELVEFIRENPTMSAPDAVWSAGEYRYGVKHSQEQPYTSEDGLFILISGLVKFEAWDQIIGNIPVLPD